MSLSNCRLCSSKKLKSVIDFGKTALANSYLTKEQLLDINSCKTKEFKANLSYSICEDCSCFQIDDTVDPKILFDNYLYAASTSGNLVKFFEKYCEEVIERFNLKEKDKRVFVIASNDGVELRNFYKYGIDFLGVEPANNLATLANKNNFQTLNMFFNKQTAQIMVDSFGKADLVMFNNVAAHIPDIHDFFEAVFMVMKDDGVGVFQNGLLSKLIKNNDPSVLYFEHTFVHDYPSLYQFLNSKGFEIFDWQEVDQEGGSFRCYIQKIGKGKQKINDNHINKTQIFDFSKLFNGEWVYNLKQIKSNLNDFINKELLLGKTFCAYGYPAKATTLCKFFEIGNIFKYAIEDSKFKQGLYTPEYHIPIVSNEYFKKNPCDYTIVLAHNFYDLIVKNNPEYKEVWINPLKV